MEPVQPACAHCAFVDGVGEGAGYICRRNPPTAFVVPMMKPGMMKPEPSITSGFPPVEPGGWCGEFITPEELQMMQSEMGDVPPFPEMETQM